MGVSRKKSCENKAVNQRKWLCWHKKLNWRYDRLVFDEEEIGGWYLEGVVWRLHLDYQDFRFFWIIFTLSAIQSITKSSQHITNPIQLHSTILRHSLLAHKRY